MSDVNDALADAFSAGRVAGVPAPVERFDTHLSHVFLSGDRAFKLKRAVRLPFVDFSSREQRQMACEAEIEANRCMADALYLGVLPVTREGADFRLGGEGPPIDWVVVMRRFESSRQFDRLAGAGQLSRAHVEQAAEAVARAHLRITPTERYGHPAAYRHIIAGLRRTEAHGAARLGPRERTLTPGSPALFERLEDELVRRAALIERRRKAGKVRHGHGDLHLRNLCLFEGRPMAFDALEFDPELATADGLYDLAFLLMDLRRVGLDEHANAAMNRYWDILDEDEDGLALLGLFMGLRAAVRMAVAMEAGDPAEAETYRALGLKLLDRREARLVAIGGLSGTGKSAAARGLAPLMPGPAGARLLRSDVLRKQGLGLMPEDRAEAAVYAPQRRADVYAALAARASQALAASASVIADATFAIDRARETIRAAAGRARFDAFWLNAPLAVRLARVAGRTDDASDADAAVALAQQEPADLPPGWAGVDADRPVRDVVADIARLLGPSAPEG